MEVIISHPEVRLKPAFDMQDRRYPNEKLDNGARLEGLLEDIMHFCDNDQLSFPLLLQNATKQYKKRKPFIALEV